MVKSRTVALQFKMINVPIITNITYRILFDELMETIPSR